MWRLIKLNQLSPNEKDMTITKSTKNVLSVLTQFPQLSWKNLGNSTIQIWNRADVGDKDNLEGRKCLLYGGKFNSLLINEPEPAKLCDHKYHCSEILRKHGLPVPFSILYDNIQHLSDCERNGLLAEWNIKYPLMIKTVFGTGGNGVHIIPRYKYNNKNFRRSNITFHNKINRLKTRFKNISIIIEQFIKGDDYRVVMLDQKIVDLVVRKKPFIIGDGISNVEELVKEYNMENELIGCLPVAKIDKVLLKRAGVNRFTVIKKDRKIVFSRIGNFHQGARLKRIDPATVHPDNLKVFKQVNDILGTRISGVDFISKDITVSYKKNGAAINEVNSQPYLGAKYIEEKDFGVYKRILEVLIKNSDDTPDN